MTETSAPPVRISENLQNPERSLPFKPLLGLQGRLAIGGAALNPVNHAELKKALGQDNENYDLTDTLLKKATKRERNAYWNISTEQDKNLQLAMWKKSVVIKIASLATTSFGSEHADFFKKMGIDINHFTDTDAQNLYTKYFSKENEENGLENFTADVLNANAINGTNEQRLATFKNNLSAVEWMAGMFGKNSAEIITQLLDVGIDSLADPAAFVANRKDKVNNLSTHEKELLTFLTEGETLPIEPISSGEPSPTDEPTPRPIPHPKWEGVIPIISREKIEKLISTDSKPERKSLGKDEEGNEIIVNLGFPNETDENDFIKFPSEPHVFIANNFSIGDKNHPEQVLKDVCVIAAHGIRTADNKWRFLNQQEIYATVWKYNDYAKKNGLPPVEFIMSCNEPGKGTMRIISTYSKSGLVAQSNDKSINVTLYTNPATGENNATANLPEGVFIGIDDLIQRKKKKTTPILPQPTITIEDPPEITQGEDDLDPDITLIDPEEAADIVNFVITSDELTEKGPTVNITEQMNRTAADKFIATLDAMSNAAKTNPANRTDEGKNPSPTGIMVENAIGIRRTDNPGQLRDKYYDYLSVLETARKRYHLPLIFLNHGGHANLALKILKNPETDGWSAIIYDPFHAGEEEQGPDVSHQFKTEPGPIKVIDIPDEFKDSISIEKDTEKNPIWQLLNESRNGINTALFMTTTVDDNQQWYDFVKDGRYDLTLLGDAELTNEAIRAKVQPFQTGETYNCVVYSLWAAFIRTAAKYTKEDHPAVYDEFFNVGLPQFEQDFGFPIQTRDNLTFKRKI